MWEKVEGVGFSYNRDCYSATFVLPPLSASLVLEPVQAAPRSAHLTFLQTSTFFLREDIFLSIGDRRGGACGE